MKQVLVVTGGSLDHQQVMNLIKNKTYQWMIAADAGMDFFYKNKLEPDFILGDFDSADRVQVNYFQQKQKIQWKQFPPEKDWTDTELALQFAIESGAEAIDLLGATGSRIDHMLANIQLLKLGLEQKTDITIYDSHNRIRLLQPGKIMMSRKQQFGRYVSLLPYTQTVSGVTLHGFKYPLTGATLKTGSSLGVSNEIREAEASVEFEDGLLILMESRD